MIKSVVKIIAVLLLLGSAAAQSIEERSDELDELRSEINRLQKELTETTSEERQTVSTIKQIEEQSLLLNKAIKKLKREETRIERRIAVTRNEIDTVEQDISELKEDYEEYIRWIYKYGSDSQLKLLLSSKSINQAVIRFKYLGYISEKNQGTIDSLESKIATLASLETKLGKEVKQQEELIAQKQSDQNLLAERKTEKQNILESLRKDHYAIENEIVEKRKAEIEIKNIIAKLIEEERNRQTRLREEKFKNNENITVPDYNYDAFENFAQLKGKLKWPVAQGRITRKFGENKNARLNTVTLNYGVDISTSANQQVYAVAEGIVSAINYIPGFGSVIIITHKNDFRTVYGHVSGILVSEGDEVIGGTPLGTVNQSLEGSLIHFEIWNERNYQNPETWLVRK